MKTYSIILLIFSLCNTALCQNLDSITDSIKQEGLKLYKVEKFAWLTSDIVKKESQKYKRTINGFVSYCVEDTIKSLFYSQNTDTTTIEFVGVWIDKNEKQNVSRIDTLGRLPSRKEEVIIRAKNSLVEFINSSPAFERFKYLDVKYNISILQRESFLFAYLLPASNKNAYFGGDFICSYTLDGELIKVMPQHKGLIRINYPTEETPAAHFHNHLGDMSPFITATDICQAKLYGKKATGISNYIVLSETYKSEFNVDTNELIITKR